MTRDELIEALDAIDGSDPEAAHSERDELVLKWIKSSRSWKIKAVYIAARAVEHRCNWWATA